MVDCKKGNGGQFPLAHEYSLRLKRRSSSSQGEGELTPSLPPFSSLEKTLKLYYLPNIIKFENFEFMCGIIDKGKEIQN